MIRAGKYTVEDSGFTVTTERIGGLPRQAVVVELPGGITGTALDALCAGPIEVLNEKGEVVQTHTGPFRIATHGLKLVREDQSGDVAALASQVATLEAALAKETSEKESAQDALASLNDKLTTLQGQLNSVQSADKAQGPEAADGTSSL
ncbi:hypothetical protein [Flintibacter sp.]|uniref:hypothetical protein n=1 Tax=Flintibacter sp. TaxID=1918624 RepID=UPI003A2A42E9